MGKCRHRLRVWTRRLDHVRVCSGGKWALCFQPGSPGAPFSRRGSLPSCRLWRVLGDGLAPPGTSTLANGCQSEGNQQAGKVSLLPVGLILCCFFFNEKGLDLGDGLKVGGPFAARPFVPLLQLLAQKNHSRE